jgi:hypothetical protein
MGSVVVVPGIGMGIDAEAGGIDAEAGGTDAEAGGTDAPGIGGMPGIFGTGAGVFDAVGVPPVDPSQPTRAQTAKATTAIDNRFIALPRFFQRVMDEVEKSPPGEGASPEYAYRHYGSLPAACRAIFGGFRP